MNYSIIVADSSETSRNNIANILSSKGYKVYQATDGAGAIRLCRNIRPSLILIDINIWGIRAIDAAKIIEDDNISSVLFITNNPNDTFYKNLKDMKLYGYVLKPINSFQLTQTVEFSLMSLEKINKLEERIKKLETKIEAKIKSEKAKGILMKKFNITEDEAYKMLRKESMDKCLSMEKIAEEIIKND